MTAGALAAEAELPVSSVSLDWGWPCSVALAMEASPEQPVGRAPSCMPPSLALCSPAAALNVAQFLCCLDRPNVEATFNLGTDKKERNHIASAR